MDKQEKKLLELLKQGYVVVLYVYSDDDSGIDVTVYLSTPDGTTTTHDDFQGDDTYYAALGLKFEIEDENVPNELIYEEFKVDPRPYGSTTFKILRWIESNESVE